jgi:dTDP-glucose pyrophosphorylase
MDTGVLLAAGRGTRMGALTAQTPKPLLAVAGEPIIAHILAGLRAAGVTRVVVVTGYRGEQIEAALGDGAALGVALRYVRQAHPEGTARALLLAEPLIEADTFVLGWGDILIERPFYAEFAQAFAARPCEAQLAVNPVDDPWQGAAVYVNKQWRVTRLEEKPPRGTATTPWNNAGLFVFRHTIFDHARRVAPSARGEHELPQAIAHMVRDGCNVRAVPVRGFWSDVGTPADLERARIEFPSPSGRGRG